MRGIIALLRRVNLRYVVTRRLRTLLTLLGVAGGVTLVVSIAVINGTLVSSITQTARDLGGRADLEIAAAGAQGIPQRVATEVAEVAGVDEAVPMLRVNTTLYGETPGQVRVLVLGVTPAFRTLFPQGSGGLEIDGGFGLTGEGMLLARTLADDLGVGVGDSVEAQTPTGRRRVEVVGLVGGPGVSTLNAGALGVMVLPRAQETFGRPGSVDSVYVVVDEGASEEAVAESVRATVGGAATVGEPGARSSSYEETFAGIATLTSLAGTVALFVSGFVVYNAMSMSFTERRREFSLALAMGARRSQVFTSFLVEAALVGALGTLLGVLSGLVLAQLLLGPAIEAYRILPITSGGSIVVRPQNVLLGVAAGMSVSLFGAFLPARRVLRLPLIESLRPSAPYGGSSQASRARGVVTVSLGFLAIILGFAGMAAYVLVLKRLWVANAAVGLTLAGLTLLLPRGVALVGSLLRPLFVRGFGPQARLAYDSLERNRGRTSLTVGALMLTLGLVIATGSALGSFQDEIRRRAAGWFGADLYVSPTSYTGIGADQPVPVEFGERLATVEGVEHVYPGRYAFVTLGGELALIYALPAELAFDESATEAFSDPDMVDRETFLRTLEEGGVIVSRFTSERLGLEAGEEVELPTPTGERSFEVGGAFDDLSSYHTMYMDLSVYQRFWRDDKADRFGVLVADGADPGVVAQGLTSVVDEAQIEAQVQTKEELIDEILVLVAGIFSIARAIQLAALIVAALTIANTMFTAVHERKWELGLQRALGLDRRGLRRLVLLEASAIGILGVVGACFMGAALGFLMVGSMRVQYTWVIPFSMPWPLVAAAAIGGVLLAAAAGVLPSRLAQRVPIIEALRYE